MQLPGRIAAAIEVLDDVATRHRPVALALKDWGVRHRFAGSGDRAAIGNLVYDALRKRASHAHAMGADTPRALVLAVAVFDWGSDPATLNAGFAADKFGPDAISDAEMARLTAEDPLKGAADHVRADVPEWLAPSLQAAFGDRWIEEARALTERPPLDLRVNRLKADPERVTKALKRFEPQASAIAPMALRMAAGSGNARTPNVQSDEGYLKGWFEIQDQGSQLVAALAGAVPGQQVLDLCAGAGGKTLALAAAMQNKGQIFAYDTDRSRLAPIYDRLKRNGARNVQVRAPEPGALDDLVGKMDRVVVDAPCTGTGTWRRRPDTKWRLTAEQLAARQAEQAEILAGAADYVKPGGQLVYITCSVLPEENSAQIAAFLAARQDFSAVPASGVWFDRVGREAPEGLYDGPDGVMLTPATTGSDGFFVAILARRAA